MSVKLSRLPTVKGLPALRWVAVLSFALLAPAALPAGGGERRVPEVRRRQSGLEPLLTATSQSLLCAPERHAPVLTRVDSGVPVKVLRQWLSPQGRRWLQVMIPMAPNGARRRGWIAG